MTTWDELAARARQATEAVADDPDRRLELRMAFYRRFGFPHHLAAAAQVSPTDPDYEFGYGRSELDFMRWEIRRGVLNPLDGSRGPAGSRWWREVNLSFLYEGELAALGHDAGLDPATAEPAVGFWMAYIRGPGGQSWYRAHNASIVTGYDRHLTAAHQENRPEQVFLNVVLYRLLYAQAMIEGVEFGKLGRFLGDPRLPSVDALVHLPDFYPDDYPLSRQGIRHVMHRGHLLQEAAAFCLDEILIHPHLLRLYHEAADWNAAPFLRGWVLHGEPVYPAIKSTRWFLGPVLRWGRRLWRGP